MVEDENEDRPTIPDQPDEFACQSCGKMWGSKGLGQHWGHPQSECEYPEPAPDEQDLLVGLWLSGAHIETQGTHPVLRKSTRNEYALEWVRHELGIWGSDVSVASDSQSQQTAVKNEFGAENPQSATQYRLTSRSCPFLRELMDEPIDSVELTPVSARLLYSFNGYLISQSAISLRHQQGDRLVRLLHEAGFTETSLYEPADGKNQYSVVLSSDCSRDFAEWIGGEPIPGVTPGKDLEFGENRANGPKPTQRVTPAETDGDTNPHVPETISLEPDWGWLCVCLTKLGKPELAAAASDKSLTKTQVYGPVAALIHRNQQLLPTPTEIES